MVIVGAVSSTVIERSVEAADALPAASVALAVMSYALLCAAEVNVCGESFGTAGTGGVRGVSSVSNGR